MYATRIKVGSKVSTQACRFDHPHTTIENQRWSYKVFGPAWKDARMYGTVQAFKEGRWEVLWHYDNELMTIESRHLVKLDDNFDFASCLTKTFPGESSSYKDEKENGEICSGTQETISNDAEESTVTITCQQVSDEHLKYYLYCKPGGLNAVNVLVGKLIKTTPGELVHNHAIPDNHQKFLIVEVIGDNLHKWESYNEDKHCVGSYLTWNMKNTVLINNDCNEDYRELDKKPLVTINDTNTEYYLIHKDQENKNYKVLDS